jgi:hypothetical protein
LTIRDSDFILRLSSRSEDNRRNQAKSKEREVRKENDQH